MISVIFGSTGRTGLELVKQALAEGYEVKSYARNPAKLDNQDDKLTVIQGEIDDNDAVAAAIAGPTMFSACWDR